MSGKVKYPEVVKCPHCDRECMQVTADGAKPRFKTFLADLAVPVFRVGELNPMNGEYLVERAPMDQFVVPHVYCCPSTAKSAGDAASAKKSKEI